MAFAGLEFHLALQVDISGSEDPFIQIVVKSPDRHIKFRVVGEDLIRRLPLCDQRGDDHILLPEFMLCQADAGTGILQTFPVLSVSKLSIIAVLMSDGAVVNRPGTAVADIRSLIKPAAAFPAEVRTGLVAGRTGGAFAAAQDNPAAYIGLSAVIAVYAEVVGIEKSAFVVPVAEAVVSDLFGDGGRIFAEESGDILKGASLVQGSFDVPAVIKGEMFLVSWYISAHGILLLLLSEGQEDHTMGICRGKHYSCRSKFHQRIGEWNLKFQFWRQLLRPDFCGK